MSAGLFSGRRDVRTEGYRHLFVHVSIVQAVCSGVVAGQLGEGSGFDGLKRATVLLLLAYGRFAVL